MVGYQLFFVPAAGTASIPLPDSVRSSAALIASAFNRFGLNQLAQNRLAFIPVSEDGLASDFLDLLPADRVILDLTPPRHTTAAEFTARCRTLQESGFRLALSDFPYLEEWTPLFTLASYFTFDAQARDPADLPREAERFFAFRGQRIARNLLSRRDWEAVGNPLFNLFQGNLLTPAETRAINRMDPSTARVMQLFNLVMNRADVNEIEESFRRDVALCYSLLCYLNSAGFGMPYKVDSIRNAIMLLGYDFLWRWLSLLIFAGADMHAGQRLLLNTALIRGRLTELLGQRALGQKEGDRLFVVGLFSLLDTLLGIPMNQALSNLNLMPDMELALSQRQGPYAPFLELALAFEADDLRAADRLSSAAGIDLASASGDHMAALEWARQLA